MTIREDDFKKMDPGQLYISYNSTDGSMVELWMRFGNSQILAAVFHEDCIPEVDNDAGTDLKDELIDYMRSGGLVPLQFNLTNWHFEYLGGTIDEFESHYSRGE